MRIIVNHLTHLNQGFICVAGLDLETHQHVRPRLRQNNLTSAYLTKNGGYFELGAMLDLDWVEKAPTLPEVEDMRFNPRRVRVLKKAAPDYFWNLLKSVARPHLFEIFGPALQPPCNRSTIARSSPKGGVLLPSAASTSTACPNSLSTRVVVRA